MIKNARPKAASLFLLILLLKKTVPVVLSVQRTALLMQFLAAGKNPMLLYKRNVSNVVYVMPNVNSMQFWYPDFKN